MIPLVHDFEGETVVVFGGGPVGARRARRFAAEADVVVVSPAFDAGDYGGARRVRADPSPEDVHEWVERTDPALVVAATDDDAVNEAAATAAQEAGALANRADEAGERDAGHVVVPATVRDDPVAVSVTTGGTSPALARELRRRIETELDGAGAMAALTGDLRADLRDRGLPRSARRDALRAVVASDAVWKALRTGEPNARKEAESVIEDSLEGSA
ncbi:MAG: bifunctional precorrin-2 dehydrogenase/sirohydrochlorin ferrochelatase [Halobacteriaceae archaeon]